MAHLRKKRQTPQNISLGDISNSSLGDISNSSLGKNAFHGIQEANKGKEEKNFGYTLQPRGQQMKFEILTFL